ncbi:GntR family transcriptional regulator [Paenibacillus antri]|uniref:GntR family transcriptional regulator n=1 Tax=Paenibacillus antri TaxID=2582848 RepID=A0A5R9GHJ8_9BACL|nr:GntR family transcriptional regulator [Paenibacillus antri]TLS52898.1 GntR family transcriptional regulator [Paenibacillus antri]
MNDKNVPKYLQVKRELLQGLEAGAFAPGERLPSEHELAERFGVSRQTIRQTVGELEREGRIYRVQGKGTFVADRLPPSGEDAVPTIGVVTTYISDYIFPHIVRGIESTLRDNGFRLVLSSTDNDKGKEREALTAMLSQPLSGLIVEPTKSAEGNPNVDCFLALQNRRLPFVTINESYPELTCPTFKTDDEGGAYLAATHLTDRGHVRVAGFFKTDDRQGVNRLRGFLKAFGDRGLPVPPEYLVRYVSEDKATKPREAAAALLERADRPTAFVCYNDELAIVLLETIRQAGLRVPDDVSLVGFDDSPLATATEVKLTTIAHPKAQLGSDAANALLRMIGQRDEGGAIAAKAGKLYEPVLIERTSVNNL